MTDEQIQKSKRLQYLKQRSEEINPWREKALHKLLTDAAPRIASLGTKFYKGCGFHYGLVQSLGNLIAGLSVSFDPCMNWLEKNEEENNIWHVRQVCVERLFKDIARAEKDVVEV